MKIKHLAALALAFSLCEAQAQLVVNGSFEAATNSATLGYISLSPGSTYIPGWTTTNAELTVDGPLLGINPPLTAAEGSDFLDLTGSHDFAPYGGVFQTIATTQGQQYQISFEVGSDDYYDSFYTPTFEAPLVTLSLNGVAVFTATNNFPGQANYWQVWSFAFTASATNTTIMFTGENAARVAYIGLDNVIVTATNAPHSSLSTPTLSIQPTNQNLFTLSWVATTNGFTLEQNTNLATSNWTVVTNSVISTNSLSWIIFSPSVPVDFFRLVSP